MIPAASLRHVSAAAGAPEENRVKIIQFIVNPFSQEQTLAPLFLLNLWATGRVWAA